jgi:hypothetical protein
MNEFFENSFTVFTVILVGISIIYVININMNDLVILRKQFYCVYSYFSLYFQLFMLLR